MLLNILDGQSILQRVLARAQESVSDHSGAIVATGVSQPMLAANPLRAGWVMQNLSSNPMYINDLGFATVGSGSFSVPPGGAFPAYGYPLSTSAISIVGTAADAYTCREW